MHFSFSNRLASVSKYTRKWLSLECSTSAFFSYSKTSVECQGYIRVRSNPNHNPSLAKNQVCINQETLLAFQIEPRKLQSPHNLPVQNDPWVPKQCWSVGGTCQYGDQWSELHKTPPRPQERGQLHFQQSPRVIRIPKNINQNHIRRFQLHKCSVFQPHLSGKFWREIWRENRHDTIMTSSFWLISMNNPLDIISITCSKFHQNQSLSYWGKKQKQRDRHTS